MAKYMIVGSQGTISSSYKSIAAAWAVTASLCRGKIAEIILGESANPNATDTYVQYDLSRITAAGTNTAFTPNAVDPADVAARSAAGVNHTVEPTVTANSSLFNVALNQRGSFRWQEIDESKMLIWAATNLVGVTLRGQSSTYVGSVTGQLGYLE